MDELANQTSPTTNGALGARFKAGLQSALSGLGGKGQSQKRLTPERVTSKADSMKQNGVVDLTESEKDDKANVVSAPTHDTDALLGEAEHGDDDPDTQDCDDALLDDDLVDNIQQSGEPVTKKPRIEPTPSIATTGATSQTNAPQPKLDSLELEKDNIHCTDDDKHHVSDNNGGTDKKEISGKFNQILENGVKQSNDALKSEQCDIKPLNSQPPNPKGMNIADNDKVVPEVSKEEDTSCSVGKILTHDTPCTPSQVEEESHNDTTSNHERVDNLERAELQESGQKADHNQVDNDEKEQVEEESKPSESDQNSVSKGKQLADKSELAPVDSVDNSIDKSVNNVQTVNSESVDDDQSGPCNPLPVLIKNKLSSEESYDTANSVQTANDGPCESSPERNRSAEDSDILTPPPVRVESTPSLTESVSQDDGDEAMEVDVPPEQDDLQTTSLQEDAVKHIMNDLIGKAVAKVDGLPISSVHTGQASPHVSPQQSDDEAEEITLPQSSAGETSDDDSRDPYAKRRKMSATPDPGRLGKLISHLSTTLDEEASQAHRNDQDVVDEDHEVVHLKKNGLASFYDTIIKKDVISDSYHEELNSRHKELQNKNSMSTKKITKILQEVKAVREKLKQMNVRPAQRSVSTQIFTEKLQVTPEQLNAAGGKILKSTIKSEKALLELQAAERKKAADVKSAAICDAVKTKEAAKLQQLQQKDVEQGAEQSKVVDKEYVVPLQPVSQLTVKTPQENSCRKIDKSVPEGSADVTKECDELPPPRPQLAVDDLQVKASRKIDEHVWERLQSDAKKCIDLPQPIPAEKFRRGYFVRKDGAIRKFVPAAHNREEYNTLLRRETQPIVSATCIFCLIDDLMVTDLLIASPATIDKINEMASVLKNKEILSRLHATNRVGYHRCCFTLILERYQGEIRERIAELREFLQNKKRQFAVNLFNDDINAVQKKLKRETSVKHNKENSTDETPKLLNPGAELDDAGDDLRITKVKSLYKGFIGYGKPQCVVCLQYLNKGYEPDQLDAIKKSVMVRKAKALGDGVMLCSLEKAAIFYHSKCRREYMAKQDVCNTDDGQGHKEDDPKVIEDMPVDVDRIITSQICIICQSVKKLAGTKYKKKYYEWPTKASAERLLEAAKYLQDEELLNLLEESVDDLNTVTYHQTCYQTYRSHLLSKRQKPRPSHAVWSELNSIIEGDIIQGKKSHAISSLCQKMWASSTSSNFLISDETITAYIKEQFPELKIARKPGRNEEKFVTAPRVQ